jgi:hypothetical protein
MTNSFHLTESLVILKNGAAKLGIHNAPVKIIEEAVLGGAVLGAGVGLVTVLAGPSIGITITAAATGALVQSSAVFGVTPSSVGVLALFGVKALLSFILKIYYTCTKRLKLIFKTH